MRARFDVVAVTAVSLALAGGLVAQQGALPPPRPDVSITTKDLMAGSTTASTSSPAPARR
jgi:hypothetical protein